MTANMFLCSYEIRYQLTTSTHLLLKSFPPYSTPANNPTTNTFIATFFVTSTSTDTITIRGCEILSVICQPNLLIIKRKTLITDLAKLFNIILISFFRCYVYSVRFYHYYYYYLARRFQFFFPFFFSNVYYDFFQLLVSFLFLRIKFLFFKAHKQISMPLIDKCVIRRILYFCLFPTTSGY